MSDEVSFPAKASERGRERARARDDAAENTFITRNELICAIYEKAKTKQHNTYLPISYNSFIMA